MSCSAFEAVVFQCGVDGLSKDPLGGFNLDTPTYIQCVQFIQSFGLPTLYLGGGGYVSLNAAKCWAACTLAILGRIENPLEPIQVSSFSND